MKDVSSVEVLGMVAGSLGYLSDVEPQAPGKVTATAYGENNTITANGISVADACERLIDLLVASA